jgi:hypothetical protein
MNHTTALEPIFEAFAAIDEAVVTSGDADQAAELGR